MSRVITSMLRKAAPLRFGLDVIPLRLRIRERGDPARRKSRGHPEGERAPAAAELEDALAVGEAGALAGRGERGGLGLRERAVGRRPEAAAVLAVRPEHGGEERGRQFVVLLVGLLRHERERRLVQRIGENAWVSEADAAASSSCSSARRAFSRRWMPSRSSDRERGPVRPNAGPKRCGSTCASLATRGTGSGVSYAGAAGLDHSRRLPSAARGRGRYAATGELSGGQGCRRRYEPQGRHGCS